MPNHYIHVITLYPVDNERLLAFSGISNENIQLLEQQLDIAIGGNGSFLKVLFEKKFNREFFANKYFTTTYQEHAQFVEEIIDSLYKQTLDERGKVNYLSYQDVIGAISLAKNFQEQKLRKKEASELMLRKTSSLEETKDEQTKDFSQTYSNLSSNLNPSMTNKVPTAADAAALHAQERAERARKLAQEKEASANLATAKALDEEIRKDFSAIKPVSLFPITNKQEEKVEEEVANPGFSLDQEVLGEDLFSPLNQNKEFKDNSLADIDLFSGLDPLTFNQENNSATSEAEEEKYEDYSHLANAKVVRELPQTSYDDDSFLETFGLEAYIANMSDEELDGNPEDELALKIYKDDVDLIKRMETTVQDFAKEGKGYAYIMEALERMFSKEQVSLYREYQETVVDIRDQLNIERDFREEQAEIEAKKEAERKSQEALNKASDTENSSKEEVANFWTQQKVKSSTAEDKIAKARAIASKALGGNNVQKSKEQELAALAEGGCGSGCGCGGHDHDHGRPVLNYPKKKTNQTIKSLDEDNENKVESSNSILAFDRNAERLESLTKESSKIYGKELTQEELISLISKQDNNSDSDNVEKEELDQGKTIVSPLARKRVVSGIVDTVEEEKKTDLHTPITKPTTKAQLNQQEKFLNYSKDNFSTIGRGKIKPKTINQQLYIDSIKNNDITFGLGPAGSGKSFLAVAMAIDALLANEVRRIILVRPAVEAGEKLGFLPGDISQKLDPYLRPLYDALVDILDNDKVNTLMEKKIIEIAPLAYMRGRTLSEAFIILDEGQNTTKEQMKMFLTRLGFNSKMVITGDTTQIDLPNKVKSGIIDAQEVLQNIPGVNFSFLYSTDVVRHHTVTQVVNAYEYHEALNVEKSKNSNKSSFRKIQEEVLTLLNQD